MAENSSERKPRIRKTAPTVRERAEQAQAKAAKEKPQRLKKAFAKVPTPKRRPHLPKNRFTHLIGRVLRPVRWVLRRLTPRYFINSWRELRLVTWPSGKETWRLTAAVFIFALVFGALVAVVDKGLDVAFKHLVLK